jgi:hypothetical protein
MFRRSIAQIISSELIDTQTGCSKILACIKMDFKKIVCEGVD